MKSKKTIREINIKNNNDLEKGFEELQILFEIKDIKKINNILEGIFYNINVECSETVNSLSEKEKVYVLHYRTKEINLFNIPYEYGKINKQYGDIISKIQITNQFKSEEPINLSECKEITLEECIRLINSFTKEIESSLLEVIIINSVLGSLEASERQIIVENLEIDKDYLVLKKLLGGSGILTFENISEIFQIINTRDYFLLKTIFYFIFERDKGNLDDYINRFHQIKGRGPFLPQELNDMRKSLTRDDIILELFFRNYIQMEKILEKVIKRNEGSKIYSKITIPLDHIAYDFEKLWGEGVVNLIKNFFKEDPKKILDSFKKVLGYETKRIKGFELRNTIISFDYADTEENRESLKNLGIYDDSITDLILSKRELLIKLLKDVRIDSKESKDQSFHHFCIFKGRYQGFKTSELTWDQLFKIKDIIDNVIECKIKKNKGYYERFELGTETIIEVQSILHVTFCYGRKKEWQLKGNYFLEILDLKVLKGFKPLKIEMGTDHIGENMLENTHKGLSLYKYSRKGKVYHKNVLAYPLELLNIYEGENDRFYKCRINNEIIVKTKIDLYKYLENETNYAYISGKDLKDSITNVLRKSEEVFNIKVLQMYHTAGVFLTKDTQDFIIVHPFKEDVNVIGENDIQNEYIERIKEIGIDFDGKLTKEFYKILHVKTMKEET